MEYRDFVLHFLTYTYVQLNALCAQLVEELVDCLEEQDNDPNVGCIVLTGSSRVRLLPHFHMSFLFLLFHAIVTFQSSFSTRAPARRYSGVSYLLMSILFVKAFAAGADIAEMANMTYGEVFKGDGNRGSRYWNRKPLFLP